MNNEQGIAPIIKTTTLAATPEALFDAYTDPEQLEKWFAVSATIDLRENGAWRYEFGGGLAAEGRVLEAVRPGRFVWTWEKSITPDQDGVEQVYESEVVNTYTFEAVDGGTQFTIEETHHASQEVRDMSEGGIDEMLTTLKAFVEDGIGIDQAQASE
jgi:uncharacterized protein YndB with AHSA1/START domain